MTAVVASPVMTMAVCVVVDDYGGRGDGNDGEGGDGDDDGGRDAHGDAGDGVVSRAQI
jgi:hypothetical protein